MEEQKYNIFIRRDLGTLGTSSFSENINVPFIPRQMKAIIKYLEDETELGLSMIRCTQLIRKDPEPILGVFCDSFAGVLPERTFTLGYPINGNFTFEILSITNLLTSSRTGDIIICLEFTK